MIANASAQSAIEEGQIEILRMAAQCFMDRGFASTSIDDVARRLGSTKGRIYHFFASKADLFFAVAEVGMEFNYAAINPILTLDASAIERLRKMAFAHCMSMIETRGYQHSVWQGVEIHLRGSTTPEQRERLAALIESRERYSNLFKSVLEEAARDGHIQLHDPSIARQLMFMTLNSPIFWYKPRPGETAEDRQRIARQCTEFAMAGLGDHGQATQRQGGR
jgi:AcrR family transcriptional regulator